MGFAEGFKTGWSAMKEAEDDRLRKQLAGVSGDYTPTQTAVASGVEALAAAQQAKQIALSDAQDDTQRQQIEQDYAPTMQALEADKTRPAGVIYNLGAGGGFQQRDKAFAPNEVTDAKIAARAGIYRDAGKDEEADRLESMGLQRKASDLQIKEAERQDAFRSGWGDVWKNSPVAQAQAENRQATPGEQMGTVATMMNYKAQHGQLDPSELMNYAEKFDNIKKENYAETMRLLHAGASKEQIATAFNKSGEKIDPASISSVTPVTVDINGKPMKTNSMVYTDQSGNQHTLIGARELDGLGKFGEFFSRQMLANADTRGDKQLDLAREQLEQGKKQLVQTDNGAYVVNMGSGKPGSENYIAPSAVVMQGIGGKAGKNDLKATNGLTKLQEMYGVKDSFGNFSFEPEERKKFMAANVKYEQNINAGMSPMAAADAAITEVGGRGMAPAPQYKVGQEQVVQSGQHKGKTAIWNGMGWEITDSPPPR